MCDKLRKVDLGPIDADFSFEKRIYKTHIINQFQSCGAEQISFLALQKYPMEPEKKLKHVILYLDNIKST